MTLASQGTTAAFILLVLICDPQRHPGQVPGPGHLPQDRPHPPGDRAHRAARPGPPWPGSSGSSWRSPWSPSPSPSPARRSRSSVSIRRLARPPTRSSRSGWIGSGSGAGDCWSRWRCSAVAIAAAVQVPIVVLPLVLGIVLASTLLPFSRRLERPRLAQGRAALGATLGATVGVVLIVGLTIVALAGPANDIVSTHDAGATSSSDAPGGQGGALVALRRRLRRRRPALDRGVLQSLAGSAVIVFLAVLLTFYFLRDGDTFWATFLRADRAGPAVVHRRGRDSARSTCSAATCSGRVRSRSSAPRPSS